jgi:hypothetical protein
MTGGAAAILLRALTWLAVGGALGVVFFALLRATVSLYATGRSWAWGVVLHVARWAILVSVLVPIARAGALPLLATGLGVFVARVSLIHAWGGSRS